MTSIDWVEVAKVRSVQAQRRELRLDVTPPYAWPDPPPEWIHLKMGGQPPRRLKVAYTSEDHKAIVLELVPGVPRDYIAGWRGALLLVTEEELEAYIQEGWHAIRWKGYTVLGLDGAIVGKVREVWVGPATAFTVESDNGDAWALPAIEQVVTNVDEENRTLTITGFEPHGVLQ